MARLLRSVRQAMINQLKAMWTREAAKDFVTACIIAALIVGALSIDW